MTTLGCNGLTADHHEYHQVFGSGAVIQPNELIHTAPSAQLQRDLRCEMFRINGF
jgi:hypothetical protein